MDEITEILSRWSQYAHSWLHANEPELIADLAFPVRIVIVWLVGALIGSIVLGVLRSAGELISDFMMKIARFVSINLGGSQLGPLAGFVVGLESVVGRWGWFSYEPDIEYVSSTEDEQRQLESQHPRQIEQYERWWGRGFSTALEPTLATVGFLLGGAISILRGIPLLTITIVRFALKPSVPMLTAWIWLVWFFQWFDELATWLARWSIPTFSAAQVIAVATLAVVLYITLGADIRGRAEINKHASFEVRRLLLTSRRPILEAAKSIRHIRRVAQLHLDRFPQRYWVAEFTGIRTVHWNRSTLHLRAKLSPPTWNPEQSDNRTPRYIPPISSNELKKKKIDADEQLRTYEQIRDSGVEILKDANRELQDIAAEILKTGISDKVETVLTPQLKVMWESLIKFDCHIKSVIQLPIAGSPEWLERYASEPENVQSKWLEMVTQGVKITESQASHARQATQIMLLESVKESYIDLWWLAVFEHRMRRLEHRLRRMLNPSLLDRFNQAIGK